MQAEERIIEKIIAAKSKNSAIIVFNTGESINLSLDIVLKYKLAKKVAINQDLYDNIIKEERLIAVKQKAYSFVSYKRRTERQIEDKLKKEGYDGDEIASALDFLRQFNYIDDKKYAQDFISDILQRKSIGKAKLKIELMKRGVGKYDVEDALNFSSIEEDAGALIKKAAEKKMRTLSSKPKEKQKNSLIAYLQRQGFEWSLIKETVGEYFSDFEGY
jgi:regulatory protein